MNGKAFFIDTTVCTACRGCQIACKQWNQLPATKTRKWGSQQNPKDLSFYTYKVVRFEESLGPDMKPVWYFFPDQCRHCLEPPCKEIADEYAPGGVIIDNLTGAVLYTDKLKKAKAGDLVNACPYNIPRTQEKTNYMSKCTMCVDRVHNGLLPACVQTCPTGGMNFGDRKKMVELAERRLAETKPRHPKAELVGLEDLRCIHLLVDEPKSYYLHAAAERTPRAISRKTALKRIGTSLKGFSKEWELVNRFLS